MLDGREDTVSTRYLAPTVDNEPNHTVDETPPESVPNPGPLLSSPPEQALSSETSQSIPVHFDTTPSKTHPTLAELQQRTRPYLLRNREA